jgi:hypothetical protein
MVPKPSGLQTRRVFGEAQLALPGMQSQGRHEPLAQLCPLGQGALVAVSPSDAQLSTVCGLRQRVVPAVQARPCGKRPHRSVDP